MTSFTWTCLGNVIEAKKRTYYNKESKFRIILNGRIIAKADGFEMKLFVQKLKSRMYLAKSIRNKKGTILAKKFAQQIAETIDIPMRQLPSLF